MGVEKSREETGETALTSRLYETPSVRKVDCRARNASLGTHCTVNFSCGHARFPARQVLINRHQDS
jgi:hypothetical protein